MIETCLNRRNGCTEEPFSKKLNNKQSHTVSLIFATYLNFQVSYFTRKLQRIVYINEVEFCQIKLYKSVKTPEQPLISFQLPSFTSNSPNYMRNFKKTDSLVSNIDKLIWPIVINRLL